MDGCLILTAIQRKRKQSHILCAIQPFKMFSKSLTSKDTFLEQTKAAREERALEKKREQSAIKIQAIIRGWLARQRFVKLIL